MSANELRAVNRVAGADAVKAWIPYSQPVLCLQRVFNPNGGYDGSMMNFGRFVERGGARH